MPKYTTNVKGNITGVVQGDGATVVIHDGEVVSVHTSGARADRLIRCPRCKELVPDAKHCIECGRKLK